MNKSKFSEEAPGQLKSFYDPERGEHDWLFVPNEMPPQWEFAPQLWPLLVKAREALGKLDGIGHTLPNPQLLLWPLQNREAVTSSAIEGTHITSEQLAIYELDPKEPTSKNEETADRQEVHNYIRALRHGNNRLSELPICIRLIKEVHEILMHGVRGHDKQPGQFRTVQVSVGKGYRFIPSPPNDVQRLMGDFEKYANAKDDERVDPLISCFMAHYQFETIHPFRDGNGRVGRAILSLMVSVRLNHSLPWLYMSPYFERFNDEYEARLFAVSTTGDWTHWIEFCLRGAIAQANDSIKRCHALKKLQDEYTEKIRRECDGPRIYSIVNGLFTSPLCTIPSIQSAYKVSYQTSKGDLEKLVECGILREMQDSYPRLFYAPQITEIAFKNLDDHATGTDPLS
jgi:Fic family protein